mgnify:CR=1 FL=1
MKNQEDRGVLDETFAAMFSNLEYSNTYLFYAHMIGQCSVKIDRNLPAPAGVAFVHDHYNMYVNPDMLEKYTPVGRLAIMKHEMLHILDGHVNRIEDRAGEPWNIAADCAINQHIDPDHLPSDGILPCNLGEKLGKTLPLKESAETYYDLIDPEQNEDGSGNDDGSDLSDIETLDDHGTWSESVGDEDLRKDITRKMIERSQEETIKGRGTVPNQCSQWLQMVSLKSEVNWKKILRGIVGNKRVSKRSTIMRSDRRFPSREDLRGKIKDRNFNLLVIPDVSGSMSNESLLRTLSEVKYTCDVTKTDSDMIQVDTLAHEPEKLSRKIKGIVRKGNGGTYLSSALDMAKERSLDFQAVVVLTDGGLSGDDVQRFADLRKKVIWLIEPSGQILSSMNQGMMQAFKLKN